MCTVLMDPVDKVSTVVMLLSLLTKTREMYINK